MIRFIITVLFLFVFGVFSIFWLGILWIVGKFNSKTKERLAQSTVQKTLKIVSFLAGVKLTVIGREKIPDNEAVLYVANHSGFYDIVTGFPLIKGRVAFISKRENRFPILTQYMNYTRGMFFDRNDIKQGMKVVLNSIELIKEGISIFIFPEGTRTRTGELNPFKEGSFKIASKTGCKVVPIAISGTAEIFEKHLPWLKSGEVVIEFGDPFVISELAEEDRKFPGKYTQGLIQEMLNEIRNKRMRVIVGLGNPKAEYKNTRHNMGFDTIDVLADKCGISMDMKKHKAICGKGMIEGNKVILAKPQTFMNLSGQSVSELVNFYKIDPSSDLIVVYDDIDLEPGQIRIRKQGSAGGHNGMKSVIGSIGTQDFVRIRVGVGAKPKGYDLADYVLGHFTKDEREVVDKAIIMATEAIKVILKDGTDQAMNQYNRKVGD